MGKPGKGRRRHARQIVVYVLILGAATTVVALAIQPRDDAGGATPDGGAGDATRANYEYDAVNDRYWHIDGSGGHWHDGRPPAVSPADATRANYEYDAVNDRYWHIDGSGGHWHDGPPPPVGQR